MIASIVGTGCDNCFCRSGDSFFVGEMLSLWENLLSQNFSELQLILVEKQLRVWAKFNFWNYPFYFASV